MRRNIKVRDRHGVIRDEVEGYVLSDGESFTIPISMMDSSAPRMITDSRGNPAGQRPGFLYDNSDIDLAVTETLRAEYRNMIEGRWRSDRWSKPTERAQPVRQSFDSPQAAVEDAYTTYNRDIQARWQRQK